MRLLYNSLIIDFMESIMEFLLAADNVVEELDAENDQLTVVKVNVDNELDLASKYAII